MSQYSILQNKNTENNVKASRLSGAFQPTLSWIKVTGQCIILVFGSYLISQGKIVPGKLVSFILYWEWFMHPAINFGAFSNELLVAMASAERIFSMLDEEPQIKQIPEAEPIEIREGAIQFQSVSFTYGSKKNRALTQVNFEILPGTTVALVGTTGSGKSTILSLLARFYDPEEGRILIDGHDLRSFTLESLRRQVGIVLQSNHLFQGTVLENLRYVRPSVTDEEIYQAAEKLGCHERFIGLKNGYLTDVGERGGSLSLGERQLICFTRALVADPKVLLLDEATSAVDYRTEIQVKKAMKRLVSGRTTVIVAHRLSTIVHADQILVLDHGKLVEVGNHASLISQGGKYARLYEHTELIQEGALMPPALPV